jgi:hypothetical protein
MASFLLLILSTEHGMLWALPQADAGTASIKQLKDNQREVKEWLDELSGAQTKAKVRHHVLSWPPRFAPVHIPTHQSLQGEPAASDAAVDRPLEPLDQRPLCTPDIIHHIVLREPENPSETPEYVMFKCGYPTFSGIVVSPRMLLDHRMVHYNIALDQLLREKP